MFFFQHQRPEAEPSCSLKWDEKIGSGEERAGGWWSLWAHGSTKCTTVPNYS